jgi:predicted GIY-YIG superfamily endonuclease
MKTGYVYALLFDDCSLYIGATHKPPRARMREHALAARNGAPALRYQLWRAVGAPTLFVLGEYADAADALLIAESRAIVQYGTLGRLNPRAGGNGRR